MENTCMYMVYELRIIHYSWSVLHSMLAALNQRLITDNKHYIVGRRSGLVKADIVGRTDGWKKMKQWR